MTPRSARALVSLAGRTFLPLAWLARLPLAMGQIAVLLLVADTTGSYGAGGLAAGALALGSAVGGPVGGAVADRVGQRRVLLVLGPVHGVGLLTVAWFAARATGTPTLLAVAFGAGLFAPQVGPLVRVRWAAMTRRTTDLDGGAHRLGQAFAYEGAADESTFVAGPAIVGLLASVAGPTLAPVVAAALSITMVSAFALHRSARLVEPGARPVEATAAPAAARRGLPGGADCAVLLVGGLLLGVVFGGTQSGVTTLAGELGRPGAAGLVYAVLGIGSALAGLASAALPHRVRLSSRLPAFAAGLAVLSTPLLAVGSLAGLAVAVAALGLAVAPYLITLYALTERTVPLRRAASVMTLLSSSVIVGYAVGSSSAGALGDDRGHRAAFVVPVVAGFLALVTALAARPRLARLEARRPSAPPPPSLSCRTDGWSA